MDLHKIPPHDLCYELDKICPPRWFTYSGPDSVASIYVYASRDDNTLLAKFVVDDNNPIDYVLTKILLQFSGGA